MENYNVEVIKQVEPNAEMPVMPDLIHSTGGECDWVLQKGKNLGNLCGRKCVLETSRCKYHYDKEQEPESEPELKSIPEDEDEVSLEDEDAVDWEKGFMDMFEERTGLLAEIEKLKADNLKLSENQIDLEEVARCKRVQDRYITLGKNFKRLERLYDDLSEELRMSKLNNIQVENPVKRLVKQQIKVNGVEFEFGFEL